MTDTENVWCSSCRKVTTWKKGRSRVKCGDYGTAFPCPHACTHADCREAKGELVANDMGVLRPPA